MLLKRLSFHVPAWYGYENVGYVGLAYGHLSMDVRAQQLRASVLVGLPD